MPWLVLAGGIVLLDLYIVFLGAERFGLCPTVITLMLVGMVGAQLVKLSGVRMIKSFQDSLARGEPPPEGVLEGLLLLASGIAFALPGVVTDVVAFVLLVPAVRKRLAQSIRRRIEAGIASGTVRVVGFDARPTSSPIANEPRGPRVIDVEGTDITERDDRRLPP
jgi:UPF0716 protein FxsA